MKNREPVLFSNSILGLFAAVALAALYWAFPGERLWNELIAKPVDTASLAYTRAAFNRKPDDPELRLHLAAKLFEIGETGEAGQILAPLMTASNPGIEIREISIKIKFRRYFEIQDKDQKKALHGQLASEIAAFFPNISAIPQLEELADLSFQLGEPLLAAGIYRRIIEIHKQTQPQQESVSLLDWLGIKSVNAQSKTKTVQYYINKQLQALLAADAGEDALKWSEYYVKQYPRDPFILRMAIAIAQAQEDVIRARDWGRLLLATKDDTGAQRPALPCQKRLTSGRVLWECDNKQLLNQKILLKSIEFIQFMKHLKMTNSPLEAQLQREFAANQLDNSLYWIQQLLKANPNATETLQFAVLLAQSQGETGLAKRWHAKLLALNPKDVQLLKKQIELEMAAPDLPQALFYAQKWQQLFPNDSDAHAKLADIAQWSDQPEITLNEWIWLFRHTQNSNYLSKLVPLAMALYQYQPIVDLFAQVGRQRQLTEAEATTWIDAIQKSGIENSGSDYLTDYLTRWPKHQSVWLFLVGILDNSDRTDAAITTLQTMERHFGATVERRLKRIDYLIKLGRIQDAWQLLTASKALAKPENVVFWEKYADVAFWVGAENELLTAYRKNRQLVENNSMLNYYFLNSLRDKDDSRDYEHYALSIWRQSHNLSVALDLIDFKMQRGDWEHAKSLLASLHSNGDEIDRSVHYWLVKAELAEHFNDRDTANKALRKALAIEPETTAARGLLIWHLVTAGDHDALKKMLRESERFAQSQSKLWESMAVGYRFLNESKQALYWYAKAIKQWPERHPLLFEYAQILQETGQTEQARRIWRYVLKKLTVKALIATRTSSNASPSPLERRYGEILRLYLGAHAGEQWLNWLQRHQDNNPAAEFSEYRIAGYLAQQRFEQAKALATQSETPLPDWQRLALATHDNDVAGVSKILQTSDRLTPLDKISALRTVGEDQRALALSTTLLNDEQKDEVLESLRRQVADLGPLYPNGWALSAKAHNVSELDFLGYAADIVFSKGRHGFWLNYKDQYLSSSKESLHLNADQKHERLMNIEWRYRTPRYHSTLKAGVNLRNDKDFFTVEGSYDYTFIPGWRAYLQAGYNLLSNDSSVFRLAGLTDVIDLRLSGEFSKREYFSLYTQGKHYKTRYGESIGFGYGGGAEIGYHIWFAKPEWVIALYGSWKEANLDHELPAQWRELAPSAVGMSSVLNATYKVVGLDLRLKEGDINPFGFTDRSFRYFAEGGVFLGQPPGNLGAKITAGLGMRVFNNDELSLSGYYSSVQGGAQSLPSTALELRYSKRFD